MQAVVSAISAEGLDHSPGQSAVAAAFLKRHDSRRVGALLGCCSTMHRPRN